MKPTSSFKMDKETKRIYATLLAPQKYEYKSRMIDAQLAFEKAKRDALKTKRNDAASEE